MKENWAKPGMPPLEYEILDRWVIPYSEDAENRTEYIWIKGVNPHLGMVIDGLTGKETFVELHIHEGVRERIIKYYYNLVDYHPLYKMLVTERIRERQEELQRQSSFLGFMQDEVIFEAA